MMSQVIQYCMQDKCISKTFPIAVEPVPRVASAATEAHARARGAGLSRTHQQIAIFPLKGLRDPEEMAME